MADSMIKVVMVGCGAISGAWLEPLKGFTDVKIVGLVDLIMDNANNRKQEYHLDEAIMFLNSPLNAFPVRSFLLLSCFNLCFSQSSQADELDGFAIECI